MKVFKGFLLSYIRYGDHDAILNCFTESHGYFSFFAKGIYAPSNKKKAYLFPLNEVEITVNSIKNGQIVKASKIELLKSYYDEKSLNMNCILMFSSDFLHQVLRNENENHSLYSEIDLFLNALRLGNMTAHSTLVFNILRHNGLHPLDSNLPFLNPQSGNFENQESNALFDEKISEIWKKYIKTVENYTIHIPRAERNLFIESLMMYYSFHFDHFRTPDSLDILKQIFE